MSITGSDVRLVALSEMNRKPLIDWNDYGEEVAGKDVLFVVTAFASSMEYADLIWEIAAQTVSAGANVTFLWTAHKDVSIKRFRIKELLQSIDLSRAEKQFLERASKLLNCNLIFAESLDLSEQDSETSTSENKELLRSIHSTWMSRNLRTLAFSLNSKRDRELYEFDSLEYRRGRRILSKVLGEYHFDRVLIPNGRFPFQVGLRHAAESKSIEYFFWERSFRKARRAFIQPFQTQDVDGMNQYFLLLQKTASPNERKGWREFAADWLESQATNNKHNPFLVTGVSNRKTKTRIAPINRYRRPLAPIFTSSLDERLSNLLPEMNGWKSQHESIVAISQRLLSMDLQPYVRLHPNLGWKSFKELIEIVSELRRHNLPYQLPWEGPSTYLLIDAAACVVTWGSTVSLESTARGIPTINMGRSRFDKLIDVTLFSPSSIFDQETLKMTPDKEKSLEAIYLTRHYGLQLERNTERPSFSPDLIQSKKAKSKWLVLTGLISQLRSSFLATSPYLVFKVMERTLGAKVALMMMRLLVNVFSSPTIHKKVIALSKSEKTPL